MSSNFFSRAALVLGYECNNKCIFCLYGDKKGNRTLEEIKQTLFELRKKVSSIMLTGGSQFRPDYFQILEYAKKLGFQIHIDTNARIFSDPELVKKVLKICPNASFSVSLHSSNPLIHEKITRAKGSWQQTVEGIKNLTKAKRHVTLVCVVCKLNYKNLPSLIPFAKSLKVKEVHFVFVRREGRAEENYEKLAAPFKKIKPFLERAIIKAKKVGLEIKTYGFPSCVVPPNYIWENLLLSSPSLWSIDGKIVEEIPQLLKRRVKFLTCKKCKFFAKCPGILKEYVDIYGGNEFEKQIQ